MHIYNTSKTKVICLYMIFCEICILYMDYWRLTHWGRVTHICFNYITIIGSDYGLSPGRHPAIIWTNAGILLIGPIGTNFNEILIIMYIFSFKKMHLKMSGNGCHFVSALMCWYVPLHNVELYWNCILKYNIVKNDLQCVWTINLSYIDIIFWSTLWYGITLIFGKYSWSYLVPRALPESSRFFSWKIFLCLLRKNNIVNEISQWSDNKNVSFRNYGFWMYHNFLLPTLWK